MRRLHPESGSREGELLNSADKEWRKKIAMKLQYNQPMKVCRLHLLICDTFQRKWFDSGRF